jgi:hypothetical protein
MKVNIYGMNNSNKNIKILVKNANQIWSKWMNRVAIGTQ